MQADGFQKMLVGAAFAEQTDVVLQYRKADIPSIISDGVKSVVFLPGAVFTDGLCTAADECFDFGFDVYEIKGNLIADIRVLGNEGFRDYLTRNNYRRLVIAFAECADAAEYGHRQEFLWVREYRAEIEHFCQLVLIFTEGFDRTADCFRLYSDGEAVFAGERTLPDIRIYKCPSAASKFYFTANELEKLAFGNYAVFFNSRNEAARFAAFLQERNTRFVYIDGAVSPADMKKRLALVSSGEVRVVLATKSGLSLMPFVDIDKVFLCGMPFSVSHTGRIAAACKKDFVSIFFSESDIQRNKKILEYYRDTDGDTALYRKRVENFSEVSEIIINELEKE